MTVTILTPVKLGVPVIAPVVALIVAQAGRPVAYQEVGVPDKMVGVLLNAMPSVAAKSCCGVSCMVGVVVPPPPPPPLVEIEIDAVSVSTPPGPVAVSVMVVMAAAVGIPMIAPVVALRVAHAGKAVAVHEVAGRFVASVSAGVRMKAVPTVPERACPAVMIGAPSEIVKATVLAALVPPPPVAVKLAVDVPLVVGVPVMAPVAVFSASPAGSPVALHEVAGRSAASSSESVADVKASPTFPVKLWPETMMGGPAAMEIAAVSVSAPPGPVAVRVIVVLPVSWGVPVIAPVVVLRVAQLGNPVALQLVTGRLAESVRENVLLKASPTLPEPVWLGVIDGAPTVIVIGAVSVSEPPGPVAVSVILEEPVAVGVPLIAPVVEL